MASNVFKDSDVERSQLYFFQPEVVFTYDDAKGQLNPQIIPETLDADAGLDQLYALGDKILNALISSEDIGIMSGDILKAYGEGAMYKMAPIGDDYIVHEIYSKEVLSQVNNTTLVGSVDTSSAAALDKIAIKQTDTGLIYQGASPIDGPTFVAISATGFPGVAVPDAPNEGSSIINFDQNDISADDVMVATRLATAFEYKSKTEYAAIASGSEIATQARIYTISTGSSSYGVSSETFATIMNVATFKAVDPADTEAVNVTDMNAIFDRLTKYSRFD